MKLSLFRQIFPEFESEDDPKIQARLDLAESMVASDWPAETRATAVGYLAAHMMAVGPYGINAKLVSKSGDSTYKTFFDFLQTRATVPVVGPENADTYT